MAHGARARPRGPVRSAGARWLASATCVLSLSAGLAAGPAAPAGAATVRTLRSPGLTGVLVEPSRLGSAGAMAPVYRFVLSARNSLDMTMYELRDPTMVADLLADQHRGVKVRVILDTNREHAANAAAFSALSSGGVHVVWADTTYEATHQKTITVDGTESLILTGNLTSEYYTTTRDFGVFDEDPADVRGDRECL